MYRGSYKGLMGKPCATMNTTIKTFHNERRKKMNPVEEFIEEFIEEGTEDDYIKAIDLFKTYTKWAIINNKYKCTNTRFGLEFTAKFPNKEHKRDGNYYIGCKLKKPIKYFEGDNNMTPAEKEDIVIKLNEIRLGLKTKAATNETAAEVRDLINTIISILTK